MYIISLGYLKKKPLQFIKHLDSGNGEFNRQLISLIGVVFVDYNNKKSFVVSFSNLNIEKIRKKKARAEKQRAKKR